MESMLSKRARATARLLEAMAEYADEYGDLPDLQALLGPATPAVAVSPPVVMEAAPAPVPVTTSGHTKATKSKTTRVREWFETHRGVPATTEQIVEAVNADGDSQITAQFVHQTVGTIKGVIRNLVKINGQSRTTYCLPESK